VCTEKDCFFAAAVAEELKEESMPAMDGNHADFELVAATVEDAVSDELVASILQADYDALATLETQGSGRGFSSSTAKRQRIDEDNCLHELVIDSKGTLNEPCFLVHPFRDQGVTVLQYFQKICKEHSVPEPTPTGDQRWMSWKDKRDHKLKKFKRLDPMANRILCKLRETHPDTKHMRTEDRGYSSKDMNVYSKGGGTGPHQDAQEFGRQVFVFCGGNRCKSSVWLGRSPVPNSERLSSREELQQQGYAEVQIDMQSGDCMVFEGRTWHQVHECIPNTSPPVMKGSFLENRRLSILVRII